jgi:hypothetical protein
MSVDNPLKWLLAALPGYIEPEALAILLERYDANKAAYYHAVKVRELERKISVYTRRNDPRDTLVLTKWREKLATLKENQL